ncbi:MAG TPA: hypothetical protein VFI16_07000 [Anaeromyxobacteraceae bacterium]|nr:hypothetical protein [Anaeromyxobacteraceae bacterium]
MKEKDVKPPKKPYAKPAIVWEEDYRPTAFGVSCAKQAGNPGCVVGPISG